MSETADNFELSGENTLQEPTPRRVAREVASLTDTSLESLAMANQDSPTTSDTEETVPAINPNTANLVNQPKWEDDNDVKECPSCQSRFTIFKRKHHCRKCGKIYCGNCCGEYCTYIPGSIVVESALYGGNRVIRDSYRDYEFRTCNSCYEEIRMLKIALGMITDIESPEANRGAVEEEADDTSGDIHRLRRLTIDTGNSSITSTTKPLPSNPREITMEVSNSNIDDLNECPVCGKNISTQNETEREAHITACVRDQGFGSPDNGNFVGKRNQNRMLVYKLSQDMDESEECVICLDGFHHNDTVARLECLCFFHDPCLKDWIQRKGFVECPVHSLVNE